MYPSHSLPPSLQVFAMDAAAFKDVWNGQYGTLSFKDANNHLIHVATVVQAKEDAAMYTNLLANTMKFPHLRDFLNNPKTTCFTDKHKGSDSAVPKICPLTEDRRCVEHLIKNAGTIGTVSLLLAISLHMVKRLEKCFVGPILLRVFALKNLVYTGPFWLCVGCIECPMYLFHVVVLVSGWFACLVLVVCTILLACGMLYNSVCDRWFV